MENVKEIFKNVRFVNEVWVFVIPLILMVIDIATGSINAWAKKEFKSCRMREGLVKKCGEIMILAIGELFTMGMVLPIYIMSFVSAYIIFMELISICENLKKMGIPIPKFISKALDNAEKELNGKEDTNDSDKSK